VDGKDHVTAPLAQPVELPSAEQALAEAIRILRVAEGETDRQLMERYERMADSWIMIANILFAHRNGD
jgi:hypothetical protein